jgi:glycosyltransferase involved in cell wall biosynthesis
MNRYQCLRKSAKLKVLWLHDTFCSGDEFVEELLVKNYIDELFTLSDFHTSYITNCLHQKRRNFEVLKNRVFVTRNGARKYIDSVDVNAKDKNLFIYNASISKGLMPLVNKIWPKLKQLLPDIKLRVIGGFYRFHDGAEPDEQEKQWRELSQRDDLRNLDVEFTGLIPQKEIAEHLASARFMIFPGAFPETFGISSLESMLYNTPVITNRFGALEEVAIDNACYKVDYAIQPNGLFPEINEDGQVEKFVETVLHAYRNDYLYLQKSQFCNIVHDVAGWGGIALQWKQHFYRKLNLYLPVEDYRAVTKLNRRIHEVYGRRFSNTEEWNEYSHGPQQHISIISPFYNAKQYLKDCILSTATQDYENFTHYLIDDASTDGSFDVAQDIIHSLPSHIQKKYKLIRNGKNVGAVCNQVLNILPLPDDDIIMMLDGDDSLINRNDLFHKYNNIYDGSVEFTYGSMMSMADNIPLIAQPYPDYVRQAKSYRTHIFAWGIPYTHLRTFRKHLINNIEISKFRHENGEWFRAGGDNATFYNIIEQADPNKIRAITDVVYRYNDVNPLNDYKVNRDEQNKTSNIIRQVNKTEKTVLIAIPTNKYIEPETFKSIYDLEIPDGVKVTFQYFYGYQIDQIRNLIASWAANFDYLFSVDSDIIFPKDTLKKLLAHNVDMVSGVYIQRKVNEEILEIYRGNSNGRMVNVSMRDILPQGLHEISGCGFGCVLVKSDVIRNIPYPQFVYHSALDHANTFSEDLHFCKQAASRGAKIYVDSTIVCDHKGTTTFRPRGF